MADAATEFPEAPDCSIAGALRGYADYLDSPERLAVRSRPMLAALMREAAGRIYRDPRSNHYEESHPMHPHGYDRADRELT